MGFLSPLAMLRRSHNFWDSPAFFIHMSLRSSAVFFIVEFLIHIEKIPPSLGSLSPLAMLRRSHYLWALPTFPHPCQGGHTLFEVLFGLLQCWVPHLWSLPSLLSSSMIGSFGHLDAPPMLSFLSMGRSHYI